MMVVFWGLLITLLVWLVRGNRPERRPADHRSSDPQQRADEVRAEKFARGEIDEDVFTKRRQVLHSTNETRHSPHRDHTDDDAMTPPYGLPPGVQQRSQPQVGDPMHTRMRAMTTLVDPSSAGTSAGPDGLPPLLEAAAIAKSYQRGIWPRRRTSEVLTGADLTLFPGEVVGLVGENGSGKSTLMKILVGALAADQGQVTRSGRLGYCPQEPLVYPRLTCNEHFDLFGHAYAMTRDATAESAKGIYEALGFAGYAGTRADQLSGGTLSKLNLGLALLADPDLLLLDEPYAGFDWDTYLKFWDLVAERRDAGRTVLIISHFVVDEERFDRIVAVRDGKTAPK